eukprot:TRINITY_DN35098_c0_g1_i1.p1 TRINITY_DN35098_c0_g1~~TRINITY_DN35098_c0_g1_i1.p1  ORF type:complete len:540 (-),score=56.28 TRINITY_DN35098_c0_g1_i1:107-1693(-)
MASSSTSKNVPEGWVEEWPAMKPIHPGRGLDKSWKSQFPLSCKGRHVINVHGQRFRLKGVNWYGASDVLHVVGGLDVQKLEVICESISVLGFTVVRMPWSNEMLRSPVPDGAVSYEMNPRLRGLPAIAVLDEVVRCLGQHKVAVILNNHTTYGEFCGPPSGNSLWFDPTGPFSESQWMADWEMMARRYSRCPQVIGFDLRNEIRPRWSLWPAFGKGSTSKTRWAVRDWADAALKMSLRLLEISPDALIVVERIVWPQRGLADYTACPGSLLPKLQGRLVLGVHSYSWSGPGRFLPDWSVPSFLQCFVGVLRAVGVISINYGDMSPQDLQNQIFREWGTVLKNDVCPVWVSEFGADLSNPWEMRWLKEFVGVMASLDVDWAYWPLNVGPKPSCRTNEAYGILDSSWQPQDISDDRLELMQSLGLSSRARPVGTKAPTMEIKRPASNQELRALYGEKDPLRSMRVLSFENVQSAVTSQRKLVPRPRLFLASSAPDFSALSDIDDGDEVSPPRKKSSSFSNLQDTESVDNR